MMRRPARILDVDGTLCNVTSVRHFVMRPRELKDFDSFHAGSADCPPNQVALDYAAETAALGMVPIVVTARMERWHGVTRAWLDRYMPVPFDGPFHRQDGDRRSDRVVKLEILRYLLRHYDIRGAIDDNPEVVELWRSQGIPVTVVPGWVD
ncbi:hypothetical protein SEA_LASTHOPE_90 [Mycobacterium phage LastHope]|uniref:Polynucleotide kinase PNKP phosphatase domain-containing protein n=1 Tax=Mycobacterium phage LastHope TaxID=2015886 RepID=A0A222ZRE1_9CAUD|nr:polynucleotide kinase [Mycobacterium phage LastHope]ASR87257.1 hypothetical protein SEA_LASTHOPE_90 [Mycobacterium phage LastHope]